MNSAAIQPPSLSEFLAWEDGHEVKHEFDGIAAIARAGGTAAHTAIQGNLTFELIARLRGKPCRFYGNGRKIRLANSARFPDAILAVPEIGIELPLRDLYAGLDP